MLSRHAADRRMVVAGPGTILKCDRNSLSLMMKAPALVLAWDNHERPLEWDVSVLAIKGLDPATSLPVLRFLSFPSPRDRPGLP